MQTYVLSDVVVAVASLDLKVPGLKSLTEDVNAIA